MPRRSILLSSYRVPTHHALLLGAHDTATWWNAWRLMWHPAVLREADALPCVAEAYEHAEPRADTLYLVPESPPAPIEDAWFDAVRTAGAVALRVPADWAEARAALGRSLHGELHDDDTARRSYALGLGYAVVDALYEAMDHDKLLDRDAFFAEVCSAAAGDTAAATAAAERLLAARDVVYPATIHLIDLALAGPTPLPFERRGTAPLTVLGSVRMLEQLRDDDRAQLRAALDTGSAELVGGLLYDRPDAELPIESQLWNLRRGCRQSQAMFGKPPTAFARATAGFHPSLPNWLAQVDLHRIVFQAFDGTSVPSRSSAAIRWPSPDGRTSDALTRTAEPADDPQTGFHLALYLHRTIMADSAAVMIFKHTGKPPAPWYDDLLALHALAPVLGTWTTVSRYLDEAQAGEYTTASTLDEFPCESLDKTVQADPVSSFARHARLRRRLDAARIYWSLRQSLGSPAPADAIAKLDECEDALERTVGTEPAALEECERAAGAALAERLTGRATGGPGWILLNACPFARRIGLDSAELSVPPVEGAVKAAQRDGERTRVVVEIPGLGYAWIPDTAGTATPARAKLVDGMMLRNELFEAEIDPVTGGLRSIRDIKDKVGRLSQDLVFQPGSTMRATEVRTTADGPALGEITCTGQLVDEHGTALADFTQRFRAWAGRPLLELQVRITPIKIPSGPPWHSHYAARFTPAHERSTLARGVFGYPEVTTQHRPGSPEYLEWRIGKRSILVLTGGLPFAQRSGPHAVDVLLVPPGETAAVFDFAIGLDRTQPAQSAQGFISPIGMVRVPQGPPAAGPTGWLGHLDSSAVLMTSLVPTTDGKGVIARLTEVTGVGGPVGLRWARDPIEASVVDGEGLTQMDVMIDGDTVSLDVAARDLFNVRVLWS